MLKYIHNNNLILISGLSYMQLELLLLLFDYVYYGKFINNLRC